MLKTIDPADVRVGMYIQGFKGNWLSHPFWRARFEVTSAEDLARVRQSEAAVVIDTARGVDVERAAPVAKPAATPAAEPARRSRLVARPASHLPPVMSSSPAWRPAPARVAPAAFGRADRQRAVALAERSTSVVKALFADFGQGQAVSMPAILAVVDDIAVTLEQNSAAFVNVTRLRTKNDDLFTHSLAVCALMIGLARETGASPDLVRAMGTAGLLHDIGKVSIDDAILQTPGDLTEEQWQQVRRHPELGHALLADDRDLPPVALDVCLHHHERLDGSGYPFAHHGDQISQATRMAAICDVYDALTSHRPHRRGMSATEALITMDAMTGELDTQLLFRFMRSVGVFPPGKLVRLRSNRLAVILPARREDQLPLVRVFYSTIDTCFIPYEDAVLGGGLAGEQAMSAEEPAVWFATDWPTMAKRIVENLPAWVPADTSHDVGANERVGAT